MTSLCIIILSKWICCVVINPIFYISAFIIKNPHTEKTIIKNIGSLYNALHPGSEYFTHIEMLAMSVKICKLKTRYIARWLRRLNFWGIFAILPVYSMTCYIACIKYDTLYCLYIVWHAILSVYSMTRYIACI